MAEHEADRCRMNGSEMVALGRVVVTRNALHVLSPEGISRALGRHASGDWGDVGVDDWQANEEALEHGSRLLSVYRDLGGTKFWIITEADRSATTVLLPEDY